MDSSNPVIEAHERLVKQALRDGALEKYQAAEKEKIKNAFQKALGEGGTELNAVYQLLAMESVQKSLSMMIQSGLLIRMMAIIYDALPDHHQTDAATELRALKLQDILPPPTLSED